MWFRVIPAIALDDLQSTQPLPPALFRGTRSGPTTTMGRLIVRRSIDRISRGPSLTITGVQRGSL
jgi:hypothetical protein